MCSSGISFQSSPKDITSLQKSHELQIPQHILGACSLSIASVRGRYGGWLGCVRTSQDTRKEGTVDWVEVVLSGCVVRHVFTTSVSVRNIKYLTETQYSLSPELTLTQTWKDFPPSQTEPCAALIHHLQRLHTRKTSRLDAGTVFPGCLRQGLLMEAGLHLVPLGEPTLLANSPKTSSPLILKLWKQLSHLS